MKMMKLTSYIGILLSLFITGCSANKGTVPVNATIVDPQIEYIDIMVEKSLQLAPYEPVTGTYLGSYVAGNSILEGSMQNFEEIIGQEQAFTVFQYCEMGDIQAVDLLRCIADKKIPYIKILPNENYDLTPVYELIGDLRTPYDTPVFLELLPVTGIIQQPEAYQDYYEKAYKVVKKHIEDVVVIWSIDLDRTEEAKLYYPGDRMVDWVGLNIYLPKYQEGHSYTPAIKEKMDLWYKSFQEQKPLMISTLAISHFSRIDHTYTVEDAKNKLNFFYDTVPNSYPRIKGILYADIDMKQVRADGLDDYRVTSQKVLRQTMSKLQSQPIFIHQLITDEVQQATQPVVYTLPVIKFKTDYYLLEESLDKLTDTYLFEGVDVIEDEQGNQYYELEPLMKRTGTSFRE